MGWSEHKKKESYYEWNRNLIGDTYCYMSDIVVRYFVFDVKFLCDIQVASELLGLSIALALAFWIVRTTDMFHATMLDRHYTFSDNGLNFFMWCNLLSLFYVRGNNCIKDYLEIKHLRVDQDLSISLPLGETGFKMRIWLSEC